MLIEKQTATDTQKKQAENWEIWTCDSDEFHYDYEQTVSLIVQSGSAVLTLADGSQTAISAGDFVTIYAGASATWAIEPPIRNAFCYHPLS